MLPLSLRFLKKFQVCFADRIHEYPQEKDRTKQSGKKVSVLTQKKDVSFISFGIINSS